MIGTRDRDASDTGLGMRRMAVGHAARTAGPPRRSQSGQRQQQPRDEPAGMGPVGDAARVAGVASPPKIWIANQMPSTIQAGIGEDAEEDDEDEQHIDPGLAGTAADSPPSPRRSPPRPRPSGSANQGRPAICSPAAARPAGEVEEQKADSGPSRLPDCRRRSRETACCPARCIQPPCRNIEVSKRRHTRRPT